MIELFRKAAKLQEHLDKQNKGKVIEIGFCKMANYKQMADDLAIMIGEKATENYLMSAMIMLDGYDKQLRHGCTRKNEGKPLQGSENTK